MRYPLDAKRPSCPSSHAEHPSPREHAARPMRVTMGLSFRAAAFGRLLGEVRQEQDKCPFRHLHDVRTLNQWT